MLFVCLFVVGFFCQTACWGCDSELSSSHGIKLDLFHNLEHSHDGQTISCPALTTLIAKGPTDFEMYVDVKKKDAVGSTATLSA